MGTRQGNKKVLQEKVVIDLKGVGRRIREIRGFELTQADFAGILGIGQTQLSKYELGQSAPTLEILLKLKAHSGRTLDWIVTGEDENSKR
jgi:transcriptional regulator with XRE-family HTH domain